MCWTGFGGPVCGCCVLRRDTHVVFAVGLVVFLAGLMGAGLVSTGVGLASVVLVNVFVDMVGHERRGGWVTRSPWSHSIFFVSILSIVVAALLSRMASVGDWRVYLLSLAGGLSHLVLDALTPAGVAPFWPFSSKRVRGRIRYDDRLVNMVFQVVGVVLLIAGLPGLAR